MTDGRKNHTGALPLPTGAAKGVRHATGPLVAGLAAMLLCWPTAANAQLAPSGAKPVSPISGAISKFHDDRNGEPLWLGAKSGDAAQQLVRLLATAEVDGIGKGEFEPGSLLIAIREASGRDPVAVRRADELLSEAFVTYARRLQRDPKIGVVYVDPELAPVAATPESLLEVAAKAPSLSEYVRELRWMNPLYAQLREALVASPPADRQSRESLAVNLERARALPSVEGRYVVVNTANQWLYMYEDGRIVDKMKVVAGRQDAQTPLMNAYIRFAVINPYWYVPTDITARLAPNVVKRGHEYLRQQGYEPVSDFSQKPEVVDPATIDWKAVSSGAQAVQLRQLPGPKNSMGRVKFMFPNTQGIWLHDTPSKELFDNEVRLNSAGCIRLKDAWRLGSWLFQRPLAAASDRPEQEVKLPAPVPIFITYLTAVPGQGAVEYVGDAYRRDIPRLIRLPSATAGPKALQP